MILPEVVWETLVSSPFLTLASRQMLCAATHKPISMDIRCKCCENDCVFIFIQYLLLVSSSSSATAATFSSAKIEKLRHWVRSKLTGALFTCTHIFRLLLHNNSPNLSKSRFRFWSATRCFCAVAIAFQMRSFKLFTFFIVAMAHAHAHLWKKIRELLQLAISSWATHHLPNTVNYRVLCYSFGESRARAYQTTYPDNDYVILLSESNEPRAWCF